MGHSFFSHDIIGGQMGRMGGGVACWRQCIVGVSA